MHNLDPPYAHNDVKPGNVLLTHRTDQPPLAILMDFGSSHPARKQIRSCSEALQLHVCTMLVKFVCFISSGLLMFSTDNFIEHITCIMLSNSSLVQA